MTHEAQGVVSIELRPTGPNKALAPFTPGSHIDLHLPNGMVRSYSLLNSQSEKHRYVLGVLREPNSRGGSQCIHEVLRVGQIVHASLPRNNFALAPHAKRHALFAGGIGVTPILSMIDQLVSEGRTWSLVYCAQTREKAAFLDKLEQFATTDSQVALHFDDEHQGKVRNIAADVANLPSDAHLYCCGPTGMIEAFKAACAERPPLHVHLELFAAHTEAATDHSFTVRLARSGRRVAVPRGKTMLDALLAAGVNVSYSCQQGICGACETRVIAGQPDHRDHILSAEDRERGETMMICCSGSLSDELTLDL